MENSYERQEFIDEMSWAFTYWMQGDEALAKQALGDAFDILNNYQKDLDPKEAS